MPRYIVLTPGKWSNFPCDRRLGCGRVAFRSTKYVGRDEHSYGLKADAMAAIKKSGRESVLVYEAEYGGMYHYQAVFRGK